MKGRRQLGVLAAGSVVLGLLGALLWNRSGARDGGDATHTAAEMAHPMDPTMRSEHQALLDLVPGRHVATHVAAGDGAWSRADTWESGSVPGEGAIVHVPESASVTFDGGASDHLFLVRVDGELRIRASQGRHTRMVVDTLFSTPESRLSIEAGNADDGTIEIELRPFDIRAHEERGAPGWGPAARDLYSDGATVIDTAADTRPPADSPRIDDGAGVLGRHEWDPEQLSLGLVFHGEARIAGKEKLARSTLARAARKGDTTLLLSEEPRGWEVGDRLVVTGTHFVGRDLTTGGYAGTEDELRTVASIRGSAVGFERPLRFDHDAPREDLEVFVANLTRSVVVQSAEQQDLENLDAGEIGSRASRLGHVMFMHEGNVRVLHAAFHALGRTNKNDVADDFQRVKFDGLDARRLTRVPGTVHPVRTPPDRTTNPRGRYAVHLHRAGASMEDTPARIEGSVVLGGPGWGFVSHDSRADFSRNVTFGVLGAGFVAETGNETGTWEGNIAINTYGADFNSDVLDPQALYRFENDDSHLTLLLEKRGSWRNHDFGHFGDGFWFQGKLIDVRDNVSVGSGLAGYFYMFRAPDQIDVDPRLLQEPLSVHGPGGIHPFAPGLNVFTGNRSIADRCALAMIGMGGGRTNDERSVIADLVAWEVGQIGTHSQYYPGYTIKDSTFIASTSPGANPISGVDFLKVMVDVVLANLEIEGFPLMYDLRKSWSPGTIDIQGFEDPYLVSRDALGRGLPDPVPLGYAHVLIDPGFTREQAARRGFMGSTYREEDIILSSDQLQLGRFEVELDDASLRIDLDNRDITYGALPDDPIRPTLQEGHVLLLRGTKTDCIGRIPIDYHNNVLVWHEDAVQHRLEREGYFRMPDGSNGVLLEELFSDRYTAEKHVVRFVAQLDPRWNLDGAIARGDFDPGDHPGVHVPESLLAE
jgi:hypothetical protein